MRRGILGDPRVGKKDSSELSDEEIARRRDEALLRALNTPHKLHSEMKLGKRKAKASTRMAKDMVVAPFLDALEELVLLIRQNGNPREPVDSALRVFEHIDKCVVTKLQLISAPITDDGGSAFQPSDLFKHYISAVRTRDWPLVSVIEHEICSSSAEKLELSV